MAYDDMMLAMKQLDYTRFWYSVNPFLMGVGNVSKLLWNKKAKFKSLRKDLRDSLSITDASPLYDRDFRNIYEHYDEKLEVGIKESDGKGMVDSIITPFLEDLTIAKNKGRKNILRHYDNPRKY